MQLIVSKEFRHNFSKGSMIILIVLKRLITPILYTDHLVL